MILAKNNIRNPNKIYVGQILTVPTAIPKKDGVKLAKLEKTNKGPKSLENESINKIELAEVSTTVVADENNESSNHLLPVSVKKDPKSNSLVGYILVDVEETIGHYAKWSRVSVQRIRKINGFKYGRYIRLNQKIKVPFSRTTPDVFFQRRSEYHKSIQEDFFESYKVDKTVKYSVKAGVTVWEICNEIYDIPFWLLRSYNPNINLENLKKGEEITIPVVLGI